MGGFGFAIRSERGIPAERRLAVRALVHWLRRTQTVRDDVIVSLVAGEVVATPDGDEVGFACFQWPTHPPTAHGRGVWIYAATGMVDVARRQDAAVTEQRAVDMLLQAILHEFAHYEQWRAGWSADDRSIEALADHRAIELFDAFRADVPPPPERAP